MEVCRKALLHSAESRHIAALNEPVGMQGFPGFYDKRRFQRKRFNLSELLVQGQLVALHELCVDSGNLAVLMAARVHHKINTSVFLIVLFESIHKGRDTGQRCFQLSPFESSCFSIVKYPQADTIRWPEERPQKFFQRDVQCFSHFFTTSTQRSVKYRRRRPRSLAFSISTAIPFEIIRPNTHTSLHLLCKTNP